jgi:Tol biopolymer transport system component/regulation of enolase protein 1 (concanavalin A-like superfamily)
VLIRAVVVAALIGAALGPRGFGAAYAQEELSPFLRAFPDGNAVDGGDWPLDASVHMAIDDPATVSDPDYEADATAVASEEGWISTYVRFDFNGAYDLKRGDLVTLSTEEFERHLIVPDLWVTTVDVENNTIGGTFVGAEAGTTVHVFIGGEAQLYVTTDSEGAWVADFSSIGFDLQPGMGGAAEVWFDEFGDSTIFDWMAPPLAPWRDEFDGSLREGWDWANENPDKWNLTEHPGFLRIYASPYGTGGENLLLRPVTQGDFMIKTRVLFEPGTNFQFAGLVIWQDDTNFLQLGRAFCDVPDVCVGNGLYFDKILGGNFTDSNFATPVSNPSEIFLRLERRGDMVRGLYSLDQGMTWYEIGTHWIPSDFQVNAIGLTASQDYNTPDSDIPADFDFFEFTEGWGFLPEGFHDYDQGDVPSWACNAGGWAADPDDRAADVNIEIVVDDQHLTNLVAGEFRQDLLDAGVCVDGNCSFAMSLWGAISPYAPHRVDIWAQDTTAGDWVLLSNSAKTLTCRTYDIYAYDAVTGETRQITNLRDADEYNPSWSPGGKWVAHDVVGADGSHGIYVTNVKTGASSPLNGAEDGGNDAAWSPLGLLIAFDRRWVGDSSVYVVPPVGGKVKLLRSDAVSPAWSPTGLRIVFHQPSDGSIRTMNLTGGGVKLIAASGEYPAWSPDGKWIAYEHAGDIWKVRVSLLGVPLGQPIRVTTSGASDGGAAWSADSQTLVFHSGIGTDFDLWTVPAAGGMATWLTGAPGFGEYDPGYSSDGRQVAYSGFSPDGQAARTWVAAYTYDLPVGTLSDGTYPYHFEFEWTLPEPGQFSGQGGEFVISNGAPIYDGYVLLRGPRELRGVDSPEGLACEEVSEINPGQPLRFLVGWVPDYGAMTYAEASAHFESIVARAAWGDGASADLVRHEVRPFSSSDDWFQYVCTFTR